MLKSKMVNKAERFCLEKKIAVFFPASLPQKKIYRTVCQWLKRSGLNYQVEKLDDQATDSACGSAKAELLLDLFGDQKVGIIWAGRGGYGSNHMLARLERVEFSPRKIFIGSSDLTFLLLFLLEKKNLAAFYAPMPFTKAYQLFSVKRIERYFITGEKIAFRGKTLLAGSGSGILKGGCLSNLVALSGTRFWPDLKETILFLEDINERPYRLERMIWQLTESRGFNFLKGIVFGRLRHCFRSRQEKEKFFLRLREMLLPLKIPVGYDFRFGHINQWYLLPLGVKASLQGENENLLLRVEEEYLR